MNVNVILICSKTLLIILPLLPTTLIIITQCFKNMNMYISNDKCNLKLVYWICYMSMSVLSLQLRGTSARPILIDLYTYGQNIEDYINSRLHWSNYVLYQCSKVSLLIYCNSTMLRGMFTHLLYVML